MLGHLKSWTWMQLSMQIKLIISNNNILKLINKPKMLGRHCYLGHGCN